jgi:hypothetical protein
VAVPGTKLARETIELRPAASRTGTACRKTASARSDTTCSASATTTSTPPPGRPSTALHPRPDFTRRTLQAFTDGMAPRPATTFGTVNADVLERFAPGFQRANFVDIIENSDWPE